MTRAPFIRGSDTSKAAADAIDDPKLNRMEYAVLRFIAERENGATDDEITINFTRPPWNWAEPTARARRVELKYVGIVRDSGCRRGTRCGRMAIVWVLAEREPDLFEGGSET